MMALFTSIVVFALGVYGVLSRHDILRLFISVSLMLSSITLLLVRLAGTAASTMYTIVLIVWVVEVVGVIIAIAIFLYLVRNGATTVDVLREFKW